jgi:hypothetical protein
MIRSLLGRPYQDVSCEDQVRVAEKEVQRSIYRARVEARHPRNLTAEAIEACAENGRVNYRKLTEFVETLREPLHDRGVAIYSLGVICFARLSC